MLFQLRQVSLPRTTRMPLWPSTAAVRVVSVALMLIPLLAGRIAGSAYYDANGTIRTVSRLRLSARAHLADDAIRDRASVGDRTDVRRGTRALPQAVRDRDERPDRGANRGRHGVPPHSVVCGGPDPARRA